MITLYHGTSSKHLDNILKNGLLPKGNRKGNWDGRLGQSNKNFVYLTNSYAPFYSVASTDEGEDPVIIRMEIDETELDLYPDEETIFHLMKDTEEFKKAKSPEHFYNSINIEGFYEKKNGDIFTWEDSLSIMGTIACKGIPPEAISGYYVGDSMHFIANSSDMVSPMNHRFLGNANKSFIESLNFKNTNSIESIKEFWKSFVN